MIVLRSESDGLFSIAVPVIRLGSAIRWIYEEVGAPWVLQLETTFVTSCASRVALDARRAHIAREIDGGCRIDKLDGLSSLRGTDTADREERRGGRMLEKRAEAASRVRWIVDRTICREDPPPVFALLHHLSGTLAAITSRTCAQVRACALVPPTLGRSAGPSGSSDDHAADVAACYNPASPLPPLSAPSHLLFSAMSCSDEVAVTLASQSLHNRFNPLTRSWVLCSCK